MAVNLDFVKLAVRKSATNILQSIDRVGPHSATVPCPGIGELEVKIFKQDLGGVTIEVLKANGKAVEEEIILAIDRDGNVSLPRETENDTTDQAEESDVDTSPPSENQQDTTSSEPNPPKAKKKRKKKLKDKDAVLEANGIKWLLVEGRGIVKELKQRKGGEEVFGDVNTETYCYEMTCPRDGCNAKRYCKPQDVKQVSFCRACTIEDRKSRHADRQRDRRKNAKQAK